MTTDLPFALMHTLGRYACGGVAALMPENPPPYSRVVSSQFRNLDGSAIKERSKQLCGTCGLPFVAARPAIVELAKVRAA